MTGGAFFAPSGGDEEYDLDENGAERHSVQWIGTAGVKGPRWARMPLLTVGMLGIQCVWSIEMGYASPYLLELGLSKSFMSLVFMAGPLSGLIVQPLIGIFADRSRSPLGRRRPFMLIGCAICVSAMMLLGWTREISSLIGGGKGLAIALAVWAIYLIDFSINAVMSTDRALVVDTLPPREQEEGSAWAGRMFGLGSVAGFFVGNLDLPPVLGFLGNTQLQILSFLTSAMLMISHTFTSWAVSERVLFRDDRPQSKNGFKSNLKSIWDNMFSLPPGIRTVCIIQFFASLGWFPILFFTTVWVSEIYKASVPMGDTDPTVFDGEAVRSGSRALLLQSLVNIVTSIGFPFLVSESGVQPEASHAYTSLNGTTETDAQPPNSALWKRAKEDIESGGFVKRTMAWVGGIAQSMKDGSAWVLPIKGLTLIKVWWISQFVFAGAMAASWFVTTVSGAYLVIAVTGFCWALSQWAPYSLLGELILIDGSIDRSQPISLVRPRASADSRRSISERQRALSPVPHIIASSTDVSAHSTPLHSRHPSRVSFELNGEKGLSRPTSANGEKSGSSPGHQSRPSSGGLSPLIIQGESPAEPELGSTVIVRHSNDGLSEDGDTSLEELDHELARASPISSRHSGDIHRQTGSGRGTADKAGVILGIHNVFLVLPQFIVTFLSAIIFYLMEPDKSLPSHRPGTIPISTNTTTSDITDVTEDMARRTVDLILLKTRAEGVVGDASSPDAVGLIFRIGGVSAAIGGYLCWRLSRDWASGKGI
ncbi:hypothetical protein CI109_103779 [Kwoniella shandongensis]|uniref:Uncharacterized protein n=1 Tax=Kwoniella shandongensis TaxID=1734106 RepID=A0A5M6CB02_9TREE|nr:uncharacterized protein CI109_000524 [Kwoniella shandongensis]KAA5530952.1 hypothetical protein CI109_000524 [Kwoniella shandongensis]